MESLLKNCAACGLDSSSGCASPAMPPTGAKNPKYLVVVSQPSVMDDSKGVLLSGAAGQHFKNVINDLGIHSDEVMITSAVRCRTAGVVSPKEVTLCGESVRTLIEEHQPDGVICLGDNAIKAVFPRAINRAFSHLSVRGSNVPYFTAAGKLVNVAITYNISNFAGGRNEELLQVWYDDLASVTDPIELKVDLTPTVIICKTLPQVRECAAKLQTEDIVAWDYETTSLKPYGQDCKVSELFSVAFAFDDGTTYAIPLNKYFPTNMQIAIENVVEAFYYELNPTQRKIAHNTKFDALWGLYKLGKQLDKAPKGKYEDTSLLCWMNDERRGMSSLKLAAWRYFGVDNWSVDVTNLLLVPLDETLTYNALDAFYTLRLYQHLEPIVCKDAETTALYRELLLPAMMQFLKIEMRGVPVDEVLRAKFHTAYQQRIEELLTEIKKEARIPDLNPRSTKQLQNYFANVCNYKMLRKTATGYSTDEESLKFLVTKYRDPIAKLLVEYRGITKLQSTYIEGMSKHIYQDGKLHGGFNLTATVTGRTSSSEPNMQNFPKRKAKEVRGIVSAPPGYRLCSFDYGQIEARLFAVVTNDQQYLADLNAGYDIHKEKALWVYRDNLGWAKPKAVAQRGAIKNGGVFPAFYGAGDATIAASLGIPQKLAHDFKRSIFERYPEIKKWQRALVKEEAEKGKIKSLFGRTRRAPIRYNELLNFTTQSTASDMTLTAMNFIGRKYEIAFMIHDDLSLFIKDDEHLPKHIDFICDAMLVLPWLFLHKSPLMKAYAPLQIECEVGTSWANQNPVKKIDSIDAGYDTLEKSLARAEVIKDFLMSEGW